MSFIDNVMATLGYTKTARMDNAPAVLRAEAEYERFNIPDLQLPESQAALYQRLTWVQIAVSQVAMTAAVAAFQVMQMVGEETNDINNHPFEQRLRRPNPLQSRYELLRDTFSYESLTGNAWWWLNRANENAEPDEIWVLPSHKVRPVPDGQMYLKGYIFDAGDGVEVPLEPHEVVHFRRFHPLNSFVGLSPVEAIATISQGDLAMQQWNRNFFAENNAKMPGVLTFSQMPDASWEVLQDTFKRKHGGSKRELAMLRNVSANDVNWVSLAMPQSDIEFHVGRMATKEEIFAIYAPGLASVLDVNATEANAIAGRKTFIESGVWPHMVAMAEKITNDVLPAYGDNLVGEFEDIRVTDRAMRLAEQSEFARYHTIDEVRAEFYGAEPIGDERGGLLPAQVGQSMTGANGDAVSDPEEEKQPVDIVAAPEDAQDVMVSSEDDTQGTVDDSAKRSGNKAQESKTFKRWLKRYPSRDIGQFTADYLTDADKLAIAQEVGVVEGAPFPVVGWEAYP